MDDVAKTLLRTSLSVAIPLWIEEMKDWDEARMLIVRHNAAQTIAEKGDVLQFGGGKKGEAANAFNALAQGLAALAFVPGGVTFMDDHWEAKR